MILFLLLSQVDSLSMDKAIDIAFSNSPSYYESKISLDKSRILFYQTLANLLPTVSVTGTYTKTEDSGLFTSVCRYLIWMLLPRSLSEVVN